MSTYRLDKLLAPRSIAVVGASPRPGSLGLTFLRNLIAGGFEGDIVSVNPHHVEIEGRPCFPSLAELPEVPDLIVVAVPPERVPGVIEEAGRAGVSVAIVATAGMGYGEGSLSEQVRLSARAQSSQARANLTSVGRTLPGTRRLAGRSGCASDVPMVNSMAGTTIMTEASLAC